MATRNILRIVLAIMSAFLLFSCNEKPPKINYAEGIFPDSIMNLEGLNTIYDDYNVDLDEAGYLNSSHLVIFSTNRHSEGGELNLAHGSFGYTFGQTTGTFTYSSSSGPDAFFTALTDNFNTSGDDRGPCRVFSHVSGYEYMFTATATASNGLNIVYSKYLPIYSITTVIPDPVPATLFNTSSDDAYVCFNSSLDTAFFCSDRNGNFDIYMLGRSSATNFDNWLSGPSGSAVAIDSLTTSANEECPSVTGNYMVFTSDSGDGYGGYDLYYSFFRNGKWSSPVNFGPGINTEFNEYRPVLYFNTSFSNGFIMFSSDREGGKGGYDLYFTGVTLEQ